MILNFITNSFDTIKRIFEEEYQQHILWIFISFIAATATYFSFSFNINLLFAIIAIILCALAGSVLLNRYRLIAYIFLLSMAFIAGLAASEIRIRTINTTLIEEKYNGEITGIIEDIQPANNGIHLKISNIQFNNGPLGKLASGSLVLGAYGAENRNLLNINEDLITGATPQLVPDSKKTNLSIRVKLQDILLQKKIIKQGSIITADVSIFPLSTAILPGGYDFGFYQYMQGIGATGFINNIIDIKEQEGMLNAWINNIRMHIYQRIISVSGDEKGNFIAAILIGITSGISKEIADSMRKSGVSHILSVSGLHLTLIATIFFFSTRLLLNISNYIAYNMNVKIISLVISLIASFLYLLLTGVKIAATRAFIMTSIFIIANMIGRVPFPIRSIFFAAFLILLISPEYVMHPSFQLSFVAVLCLISGYELYLKNEHLLGNKNGAIAKIKLYFFANIYSTIIASIATAPFVLFHFFKFANYVIPMNIIAVPLMSFIIMPLGSLALLTIDTGIDTYLLKLIGYFVGVIISSAQYIVNLQGAIWNFGHINGSSLALFSFGFFWICTWQTRLRLLGIPIMLISLILALRAEKPLFILDTYCNNLFLRQKDGEILHYSKKQLSRFTHDYIINWLGATKYKIININEHPINGYDVSQDVKLYINPKWYSLPEIISDQNHQHLIFCSTSKLLKINDLSTGTMKQLATKIEFPNRSNVILAPYPIHTNNRTATVGYCKGRNCYIEYNDHNRINRDRLLKAAK